MLFLGHVAISLALADATDSDRAATVAGNLLPDVVDKTLGWVLHVTPSGRALAHGLPFLSLTVVVARALLSTRSWRGVAVGYLGHLIADLYGGGQVTWLAPFRPHPPRKREPFLTLKALPPEVIGAVVIWRLLRRSS